MMLSHTRTLLALAVLFVIGLAGQINAQVSDVQIKKDLTGTKTVSVVLGQPGKREWSSTDKKYIWTRDFTAKVKSDDPDVLILVKGYAAYDLIGGRYVFWRSFITSNSYEGIPDPSSADVQSLIGKFGVEKFLGNYYLNHVIGKVESIGLSDEPKFEWHTPNSVSFNVTASYMESTNSIGGHEHVSRTFRIRLYRDNRKADWKNVDSTPQSVKKL